MIGHCFSKAIKKGEKLELKKNSRLRFRNVFLVNICDEFRMRDRMRLESVCIGYDIDQCSRTSRQRLDLYEEGAILYMEPMGAVLPDGVITTLRISIII